jgi:hypothetical protein
MLIIYVLRRIVNKMSKYYFFYKNIISMYFEKKLKPYKILLIILVFFLLFFSLNFFKSMFMFLFVIRLS